jgi:hypothetical protein
MEQNIGSAPVAHAATAITKVLDKCRASGTKFVDTEFPAKAQSICRPGVDTEAGKANMRVWKRPEEIAAGKPVALFVGKIEPNDIDQGELGDCWLLAAMAALAEYPTRVKAVFHPYLDSYADVGAYIMNVNKGGWWSEVVVDNYIPCGQRGTPCFARQCEEPGELWAAMMEKAYAKVHGSYAAIAGGRAYEAISDLTGFPYFRFENTQPRNAGAQWALTDDQGKNNISTDEMFKKIAAWDKENYVLTLSTPGTDVAGYAGGSAQDINREYEQVGMVCGHAYSLVSADTYAGEKLVKIRNPWGNSTEWSGAWSDKSQLWNQKPQVKQAVANAGQWTEGGADGTFWMSWADTCKYFTRGSVNLVKDGWRDRRFKGKFTQGTPSFYLELPELSQDTDAILVLSQPDERGNKNAKSDAILLRVAEVQPDGQHVYLPKPEERGGEAHQTAWMQAREVCMVFKFKKSTKYRIYACSDQNAKNEFVIGVLSASDLTPKAKSTKAGFVDKMSYYPDKKLHTGAGWTVHISAGLKWANENGSDITVEQQDRWYNKKA